MELWELIANPVSSPSQKSRQGENKTSNEQWAGIVQNEVIYSVWLFNHTAYYKKAEFFQNLTNSHSSQSCSIPSRVERVEDCKVAVARCSSWRERFQVSGPEDRSSIASSGCYSWAIFQSSALKQQAAPPPISVELNAFWSPLNFLHWISAFSLKLGSKILH